MCIIVECLEMKNFELQFSSIARCKSNECTLFLFLRLRMRRKLFTFNKVSYVQREFSFKSIFLFSMTDKRPQTSWKLVRKVSLTILTRIFQTFFISTLFYYFLSFIKTKKRKKVEKQTCYEN